MTLSHAPATNCCFAVRGSRFTVTLHRSRFTVHGSPLPAPNSRLRAAACRLSTSQCYSLTTHPVFKYMRATASQPKAHASQNKTDTRNY